MLLHKRVHVISVFIGFISGFSYYRLVGLDVPPNEVVHRAETAVSKSVDTQSLEQQTIDVAPTHEEVFNTSDLETVISQFSWPSDVDEVFLLVLVKSAPGNFERREAVRHAWFIADNVTKRAVPSRLVRQYFVIGSSNRAGVEEKLAAEEKAYGDLLRAPLVDHYSFLTVKTLWSLSYAVSHFDFQFLLMADDDTFVNWATFFPFLAGSPQEKFYAGHLQSSMHVDRSPKSKWYVPPEVYQSDTYKPYAFGIGYILTFDVVRQCVDIARTSALLGIDDAMVGWLVSQARVSARHVDNIVLKWKCKIPHPYMVGSLTVVEMRTFGKRARQREKLC